MARNRTQSRKQGQFRIARELRVRGVADSDINSALETSAAESDPVAMVRQRIERKLKLNRGEISDKKIASIYGSLLRAGFPSDVIRRELKRASSKATSAGPVFGPGKASEVLFVNRRSFMVPFRIAPEMKERR